MARYRRRSQGSTLNHTNPQPYWSNNVHLQNHKSTPFIQHYQSKSLQWAIHRCTSLFSFIKLLTQDEPITTQTAYVNTSAAIVAYLSLACAAYGSVWRTATISIQPPRTTPAMPPTITSASPKDKILFSYESNPSFFLQSGSILTSTTPGFSAPKSPTLGGQRMVKLTREEVNWVHDMLVNVWSGMVSDPLQKWCEWTFILRSYILICI